MRTPPPATRYGIVLASFFRAMLRFPVTNVWPAFLSAISEEEDTEKERTGEDDFHAEKKDVQVG
jgi:hypothetical protein